MDLHICDFLPCESFVPLHGLAGNVCISKRRFLPWATARAFMSFFLSRILTFICVLPTHLSGYSGTTLATPCGSTALITKPGTEIFP